HDRRTPDEALVLEDGRKNPDDNAACCRGAQLRAEPQRPPPGSDGRLSPVERCLRSLCLWTLSRRRSDGIEDSPEGVFEIPVMEVELLFGKHCRFDALAGEQ